MINLRFSNIRSNNLIGKFVRFPLSLLPKKAVLPIMQGSGKGMKWVVGSGVHGIWLGSYEADKQQLLSKFPLGGTTVLDIGANVGFFSLLLSRMVGVEGKVIAFEPLPRNIDFINQHIKLNEIENLTIYPVAIGDKSGSIKFATSQYHEQGHVAENGDISVSVMTLDELNNLVTRVSFVKIDVEGYEANVLRGGETFFQTNRPIILLATHGKNQVDDCREILMRYGYSMKSISQDLYGFDCDEWLVEPKETLK
ncbi:MAG: FkbM family methyltransferase [Nostocaceae cyanobacterium]|nr:FkbM family methyltransferase [Nostocaceae cyanobacterium]